MKIYCYSCRGTKEMLPSTVLFAQWPSRRMLNCYDCMTAEVREQFKFMEHRFTERQSTGG